MSLSLNLPYPLKKNGKYMKNNKNLITYLFIAAIIMPSISFAHVVTLFSHGIAAKWNQVEQYVNDATRRIIHSPYVSFNYPDATNKFYRVNYNESSFGQDNEIGRLHNAYQKMMKKFEHCDVILKGLSRGAANHIIFASRYTSELDNVKAMVLESPYFIMDDVIANMIKRFNLEGWFELSWGQTLAECIFKKYTRHGYSPANTLADIPKDMPILLICSEEDHLVPYTSTITIYKKLIESGHTNVYIFVAKQGRHAAILQGPEGEKYQQIVNAFYKKYNLPHCPIAAKKGKSLLALCQPLFD